MQAGELCVRMCERERARERDKESECVVNHSCLFCLCLPGVSGGNGRAGSTCEYEVIVMQYTHSNTTKR